MPLTREEIIQLRELLVGWSNNAMQLVTIRHSRASSSIFASLYPRVEKIWLECVNVYFRAGGTRKIEGGVAIGRRMIGKRDKIVIVDPGLRDWKEGLIDDRGYPRAANATDERMNCWKLCWHIVRRRIGSKVGPTTFFLDFGTIRAINTPYRALRGFMVRDNAVRMYYGNFSRGGKKLSRRIFILRALFLPISWEIFIEATAN